MNIQEAKEEIIRSVKAYMAKDEWGCYRIPVVRQRPVLLIGPPGIGKTAIMEQAAQSCQVGLLSYTITHHTRQSAVGLPQMLKRTFGDKEYTVTEYTLSEIVASIYEYMERTGYKEGILFIDEINCVSETLAPTMLQFLQYKTFGNHKVPEGWVIVAAGNPPEFNRSVRELDMASLDRVRVIEVEADVSVWKNYAQSRGLHPAILSYLEIKPEHFYQIVQTREKREFVTARGWEDLSVVLSEYERQEMEVNKDFIAEFLRNPKIVADFMAYYQLYKATLGTYRIPEFVRGTLSQEEEEQIKETLRASRTDVRYIFVRHLLAFISEQMTSYGNFRRYVQRKKEVLGQLLAFFKGGNKNPEEFLEQRRRAIQIKKENDLLKPNEEILEARVDEFLLSYFHKKEQASANEDEDRLEQQKESLLKDINRITDMLIELFGKDMELADWLSGLANHGDYMYCEFFREDLIEFSQWKEKETQIQKEIAKMEELYEDTNRI